MSRNEAENKVWEVDSDIIARERSAWDGGTRQLRARKLVCWKEKKNVKMEDLVRAWEKRQTQSNNKKAATIKTKTKTSFLTTDAKPPGF